MSFKAAEVVGAVDFFSSVGLFSLSFAFGSGRFGPGGGEEFFFFGYIIFFADSILASFDEGD